MKSEDAEFGRLPGSLSDVPLTSFQAILVIQTLQPVAFYRLMHEFTEKALGMYRALQWG